MKKKQIIKKEQEFTEIIKKCPYKKNNYFVIYYRPNQNYNPIFDTFIKKMPARPYKI